MKNRKGASVPLPDWLDSEIWQAFKDYRKKIKFPLTDHAEELAIRKLKELRSQGDDPTAVIEQSILNGWRGVFPLNHIGKATEDFEPSYYKEL